VGNDEAADITAASSASRGGTRPAGSAEATIRPVGAKEPAISTPTSTLGTSSL